MNRSEIKRTLEAYYFRTPKPEAKLAKLDELDALPPAIKKQLKYEGVVLDFRVQRLAAHHDIAISAFREADTEYWKHHDPGELPDPSTTEMWSWPTTDALRRAISKPPKKSTKRVDYARARDACLYIVEHGASEMGMRNDAHKMLALIALRDGKPRDAIRWAEPLSRFHAGPLMAQAYHLLGDRKQLVAWLEPKRPTDAGFRAELEGDDEAAIRHYLEAANTPNLRTWQYYGRLRLKRMEKRVGKTAIDRVKRSRAKANEKLVIKSIAEFHERFAEIAAAIRAHAQITDAPVPMSDAAIAKLRLRTSRYSSKHTVPVPKSLATVLRVDKNFRLWAHAEPLIGRLQPYDVEKLVRKALRGEDTGLGPLAKLPASVPVWANDPALPACIALRSPGDQELMLYMGEPDKDGEYPIARFDDNPELFISDASLAHYILAWAKDAVTCKIDLAAATKQARKRNKHHREWFSEHPKVTAILKKF